MANNVTLTFSGFGDSITAASINTINAQNADSSDTLTFEGNPIGETLPANTVDQYNRTYQLSGSTLTITGATSGDSLTFNDFQNGDFGVTFDKGDPLPPTRLIRTILRIKTVPIRKPCSKPLPRITPA